MRKHLLYLTSDQLCTYAWQGGRLHAGPQFPTNRAGVSAFLEHAASLAYAPVCLVVDLIEEDFQRVQLPHVGGRAGRQLVQRRLSQQYRETPYRHASIQGRETAGRRDDIALLSALTNPSLVTPWVEALETLRLPLAGLYSTTLLSTDLQARLGLQQEHLLLVTQQSGGLRQSYFLDGQLKFSRLTLAQDRDGVPANLATETGKTQQFLTSIRLLNRGDVLHAVIITPSEHIDRLAAQCRDTAETTYQCLTMEAVSARLGLPDAHTLADTLLLQLLCKRSSASHYTLGEARRYFVLWKTRLLLYSTSAVLALSATLWVGSNLWRYSAATTSAARMSSEADQYDARYKAVMSNMPPRVAQTANMKAAVTIERMVLAQAPTPVALLTTLSDALAQHPQIQLTQLEWRVNLPEIKPGSVPLGATDSAAATPIPSQLLGIPSRPPQALRVLAEIGVEQDDYRSALDSMNGFAQTLARRPNLVVEIEQPPLDTRPNVKLSGKAGVAATDSKAKFILNLMWTP